MKLREFRRARPLLGTLVEVCAWGKHDACFAATDAAFSAIARVHALMSAHDAGSDISRLNRSAHERRVRVHPWVGEVLRFALQLNEESGGAFDCGIGSRLEDAGFLPAGTAPGGSAAAAARADTVRIDALNFVRFTRLLCVDLGGIAKGYAVDRAVEALQRSGVAAGLVNAGGDLRVFGLARLPIVARDPSSPGRFARLFRLRTGAVATSAGYYSSARVDGKCVTSIFDPLRQRFLEPDFSVTVTAPSCMVADALTKVAAILGTAAMPLLQRYGAHALWWRRGRICTTWEAACAAAA